MRLPWLKAGDQDGQLRCNKRGRLILDQRTEAWCRGQYERWLEHRGSEMFGEPLGHGGGEPAGDFRAGQSAPASAGQPAAPKASSVAPALRVVDGKDTPEEELRCRVEQWRDRGRFTEATVSALAGFLLRQPDHARLGKTQLGHLSISSARIGCLQWGPCGRYATGSSRARLRCTLVTAILGLYLAVGNALRGAKFPDEETWSPWSPWFVALLGAAVFVPLYALYKALDAYLETQDKSAAEERQQAAEAANAETALNIDLQLLCQRVVSAINDECPDVSANELGTHVWLCRDDGTFDRAVFFTLPLTRKRSGIVWGKGNGVAGMAWAGNEDLRSDLRGLHRKLDDLGHEEFDQLPERERPGLRAQDVESSRQYTGICAIRLFSVDEDLTLLGIFIIDYMGETHFDCIVNASRQRPVSDLLAGCEQILSTLA